MRATLFGIALALWCNIPACAETLEMTAEPRLGVSYDPAAWKLAQPMQEPQPDIRQSARWELQPPGSAHITVTSTRAPQTEEDFKLELLKIQKFRGDPAELTGERRETLNGRDWWVLEFHNPHTRPPCSETHYFLSTRQGHIEVFVIGQIATLPKHREAIDAFLQKIRLK